MVRDLQSQDAWVKIFDWISWVVEGIFGRCTMDWSIGKTCTIQALYIRKHGTRMSINTESHKLQADCHGLA